MTQPVTAATRHALNVRRTLRRLHNQRHNHGLNRHISMIKLLRQTPQQKTMRPQTSRRPRTSYTIRHNRHNDRNHKEVQARIHTRPRMSPTTPITKHKPTTLRNRIEPQSTSPPSHPHHQTYNSTNNTYTSTPTRHHQPHPQHQAPPPTSQQPPTSHQHQPDPTQPQTQPADQPTTTNKPHHKHTIQKGQEPHSDTNTEKATSPYITKSTQDTTTITESPSSTT